MSDDDSECERFPRYWTLSAVGGFPILSQDGIKNGILENNTMLNAGAIPSVKPVCDVHGTKPRLCRAGFIVHYNKFIINSGFCDYEKMTKKALSDLFI